MEKMFISYPISVAILYFAGTTEDMTDTLDTVMTLTKTLRQMGHMVRTAEVTHKNWRQAVWTAGDIVINLVEDDFYSLYLKVARKLEEIGRVQMGQDAKCLGVVARKARMKQRLQAAGIATPAFRIFRLGVGVRKVRGVKFPVIVKPSGQHASVGIDQNAIVRDQKRMRDRINYLFEKYGGEVVVEEFLPGRELHVTVLGNGKNLVVLPLCEIKYAKSEMWNIYSYNAKWVKNSREYLFAEVECPAVIDEKIYRRVAQLVKKAWKTLGCRDIARMDVRLDNRDRPTPDT